MKNLRNYFFLVALAMAPIVGYARASSTAQKLKQENLKFGSVKLKVEVARSEDELQTGLMYRKTLGVDEGMLFIFPQEKRLSFWMKNTFIPLDIGFFDKSQRLVDIQSMDAVKSEMQTDIPSIDSRKPATYALEVNRGWFTRHKIKLGQKFELNSASH